MDRQKKAIPSLPTVGSSGIKAFDEIQQRMTDSQEQDDDVNADMTAGSAVQCCCCRMH